MFRQRWFPLLEARQNRVKQQAGFTLMELLIAMSITAIIAVMAYQSINEVTSVKANTEKQVAAFEKLQRTIWWVEQDLTQLAPRSIQDELGGVLPAYMASISQGIQFTRIAVYPSPYGVSGLVRIGYQLEDNTLYRLIWPVLDRAPDSQPKKLAILKEVEAFEVKQLDRDNKWQFNWPQDDKEITRLPRMIELTITLKNDGKIRRVFPGVEGVQ